MQPHQERVVAERDDLQGKIDRLRVFIGGDLFNTLNNGEQGRLQEQLAYMDSYVAVLQRRIDHFNA